MKDEQEFEMRRRMMEIDRKNVIRIIGLLCYFLVGLVLLLSVSSCGAAKEICPHGTIPMGCNALVGYEDKDTTSKNVEQKLIELEEKNKELEKQLDQDSTGFETEIQDIKEELDSMYTNNDAEIGEINDRINRLQEIIDDLMDQLKNKKDKNNKGKKND